MDVKEFQEKVKNNIISIAKLKPHDKILVGVSGGADSVALLVVLAKLRPELDMTLEAIHVEHGLRGRESLRDQEFVKMLCEKYEVNLVCKTETCIFCHTCGIFIIKHIFIHLRGKIVSA